ncbi:Vacuolar protein sorting-associated protein 55 [Serendipita sp. 399]|nr:Vacuolar protein sorting-associated protein 55 [Serendipita sp. 399]
MLVDYGSDSESSENGQVEKPSIPVAKPQAPKQQPITTSALSTALPKPRRRDGPLKITVEAPKYAKEDEASQLESRPIKKAKLDGAGGSSLLSMLPAPKNKTPILPQKKAAAISEPVVPLFALSAVNSDIAKEEPISSSLSFIPPSRAAKAKEKPLAQEETSEDFFSIGTTSSKGTKDSSTSETSSLSAIKSAAPTVKEFVPPVPTPNDPYPGYYQNADGGWAMHDPTYYWSIAKQWQQQPNVENSDHSNKGLGKRRRDWEGEDDLQHVSALDEASKGRAEIERTKSITVDVIRAGPSAPNMTMTAARASSQARSRHQLSTLLTDAYSRRAEIEDKIAMAKRNRKESGNKYAVIFLSFFLAVGFLLIILSCALWSNWLPLLVALIFVLAPLPNTLFAHCGSDEFGNDYESTPAVDLGRFITSIVVVSGFALPLILQHAEVIKPAASYMSIVGGALVYGTILAYTAVFKQETDEF